jgi:hypothetical protein
VYAAHFCALANYMFDVHRSSRDDEHDGGKNMVLQLTSNAPAEQMFPYFSACDGSEQSTNN